MSNLNQATHYPGSCLGTTVIVCGYRRRMSHSTKLPETFPEFQEQFATEEECEAHLFKARWPEGFECPRCGHDDAIRLAHRRQHQCRGCKYQVSVTAGTAFENTKVPLRKWFWAIFLVARHKNGISALQLQKDLGFGGYRTAWLLLQKVRSSFGEKPDFLLRGEIEIDETFIGAKGKGDRPGKGPGHKSIVVGALQLGKAGKRGRRWRDVRAAKIDDVKGTTLGKFVKGHVKPGSMLYVDGWRAYDALAHQGFDLTREISSKLDAKTMRERNPMPHIHLFFANLKVWITGCFHGVSGKYLHRYLDEFLYRLNRRHEPTVLFAWIQRRLINGKPRTLNEIRTC